MIGSLATSIVALILLVGAVATPPPTPNSGSSAGPVFGDGAEGIGSSESALDGGQITLDVDVVVAGDEGEAGTPPTTSAPEPPEGHWISVSDLLYPFDPPCVQTTWQFLEGVTAAEANAQQVFLEGLFIGEYEAYISGGAAPPPACPSTPGTPALDPTEAIEYGDDAATLLPVASPTISGGYAITGLRSWLDLGRDSTFTDTRDLDLGPFTRTATFTATATSTTDWGDGTVTTHTSRGGSYHDGEPGPEDITHTYRDAADQVTLTVTDVWDITISVPGLDDITLTYTAPGVPMTYPVREVRSTRDR